MAEHLSAQFSSDQDKLFIAIQEADLERMKLCLENGAEINSKGCHIKTFPLHYAISNCAISTSKYNLVEVIKILLQNGANVNLKNKGGRSPLHMAVDSFCNLQFYHMKIEVVKLLVQNGAQIDQTALTIAQQKKGHDTILNYLKNPNMTNEDVEKMAEEEIAKKKAEKEETKKKAEEKKARKKAEKNAKKETKKEAKKNAKKMAKEVARKESEENPSSSNDILAEDYYSILGVKKGAQLSEELKLEMKRAYKKLALEYHPDKTLDCVDSEEKFKRIGKAYEVLCNPEKKKVYDQFGEEGLNEKNWN